MWPFKSKQAEEKPKEKSIEDKCAFMDQIVLDHSSGGSVIITIQGKDAKQVEHVSKKIKNAFIIPKMKIDPAFDVLTPEQIEQGMEQLNALREAFDTFRKSKKD